MEPYIKKWYDHLAAGKLMGVKCSRCGAYEFPPVPVCNSCSSTNLQWVEMSGTGTLMSISQISEHAVDPWFQKFGPKLTGVVQLNEGPEFMSWVMGRSAQQAPEIIAQLPLTVRMSIHDRGAYKYPVYEIVGPAS